MVITASNISKSYPRAGILRAGFWHPGPAEPRPEKAVDGVTFSSPAGTVTGLAGPNGAGKSTLLKLLAGLLSPDDGSLKIGALDAGADSQSIRAVAALAEAKPRSFYMPLSAKENLEFFGALYGFSKEETAGRAGAFFGALEIARSDYEKRFDNLSAGAMQKFSLVRALMRGPEVLLLDESAKDLDFKSASELRRLVRRLAAGGVTVVYASHDLHELAGISDKTLVLKNGKLAAEIPGGELRKAEALGREALENMFTEILNHDA